MRLIFIDSAHFVALLNHHDRLHDRALRIAQELDDQSDVTFVTIDAILTEVLAYQSGLGSHVRATAVNLVRRVRDNRRIDLVAQTPELFFAALELYGRRLDKSYSLVDCMSMVACRDRKITEVLTADHDFEQEGFTILLK